MEAVHRKAIQSNFVSLVEQTDLDLMVSVLYEKGVFSEQMIEKYKDTRTDMRSRKRQLYMDIMLRGPHAFGHLTDALQEAGYWNLARDLDPNSSLHTRSHHVNPRPQPPARSSGENSFISLGNKKKDRNKIDAEPLKNGVISNDIAPHVVPAPYEGEPNDDIPHFDVKKSIRFYDDIEKKGIKPYRMRGKRKERGILLVFNYTKFLQGVDEQRPGADVDANKLRYLFDELGFKVCSYANLTKPDTEVYLKSLNTVLAGVECAFIVVSSHGYPRSSSSDVDFRCHDGQLMSVFDFLEYFNNEHLPALKGIPKVFIFQLCRGQRRVLPATGDYDPGRIYNDGTLLAPPETSAPIAAPPPAAPESTPPAPPAAPESAPVPDVERAPSPTPFASTPPSVRLYSDILIAHSTLPGFVACRDPKEGSWYIQALCEVFAEHAHDCHVARLLAMADLMMERRFKVQTSSVESWGFNRQLYLHPGLYEA